MMKSCRYFISILLSLIIYSAHAQLFNKAAKEIKKAKELIEKKQYDEALKNLDAALELSKGKDDYQAFYLKGYCEYALNRPAQAVEQFNYAVSKVNRREALPPKTEEAVLNALLYRAMAFEALKDTASAIKDLQLLASVQDNATLKSQAYHKWAEDFYGMHPVRNHNQAETLVSKAIEVNSKNAAALSFLAQLAIDDRSYDEAVQSLEKVVSLETDPVVKSQSLSLMGLCKYKLGAKDEALKVFQQAVDNAPESSKWKIYQQQANLVIQNRLYDGSLLQQAKQWAGRAAILSDDCSNKITLAYIQALNNELADAAATIKQASNCNNPSLKLTGAYVSTWIADMQVAKTNIKAKIYGNNSWYYWGGSKLGAAEGKGKAMSRNYLYEVKDATFAKGAMLYGTLINVTDGWNYTGAFLNGMLSGSGKIIYSSGDVFSGKFAANQPNGLGKWIYADSSTYEGTVVQGKPEGTGLFKQKNGMVYQGGFKDGQFNGRGVLIQNGVKENVIFTNGQRTDAAYLAKAKAEQAQKEQEEALAMQKLKETELAKAEKRKKFGNILGKSLALAGGAVAIKQATDLGMSTKDATELGAALVSDVVGDGKQNNFMNTLAVKNATGNLGSNKSLLSVAANQLSANNLLGGSATSTSSFTGGGATGIQDFQGGNYTSADGGMTVNIRKDGANLIVIDPYQTSVYTPVAAGLYTYTSKRGTVFFIQIKSDTQILAYTKGYESQGTPYSFSGNAEKGAAGERNTRFANIAKKYLALMKTDSKDAQLWALCGAAANAGATLNETGYEDYARKAAASIKQIIVNPAKCPCEDAIPTSIWNSVK